MNQECKVDFELVRGSGEGHSQAREEWRHFVLAQPSVHLEQLWAWGEVRRVDGWQPELLVGRIGGGLAAGCLILHRRLNRFLRVGYVSRGPLIGPAAGADPPKRVNPLETSPFASRRETIAGFWKYKEPLVGSGSRPSSDRLMMVSILACCCGLGGGSFSHPSARVAGSN